MNEHLLLIRIIHVKVVPTVYFVFPNFFNYIGFFKLGLLYFYNVYTYVCMNKVWNKSL